MYNNINRIIGLSCWKRGIIDVVMSFELEFPGFFCNEKPNLGKSYRRQNH